MTMMNTIKERLRDLREVMQTEHLGAFIFPHTDAHQSEYVAPYWQGLEWISGFTGSAGTAVVTMRSAALWTDSRYFLAAEEQLRGTGFELMKLKMPGTPSIAEWIASQTDAGCEVGVDGSVVSDAMARQLTDDLRRHGGMTLRVNFDPLGRIWHDRPALPAGPVMVHPAEYAGEETASKISRIRQALRLHHCDGILLSALDDIAWTLNLRGHDVHCNPVFVSYLVIEPQTATLFVHPGKLTDEVRAYLKTIGIGTKPYDAVAEYLQRGYFNYNILLDPDETSSRLAAVFPTEHVRAVRAKSPVPAMKAVKNETEIAGFRRAMVRDGVAMVKFLRWLKPAVEAGGQTECSLAEKLRRLRAEQPLFRDISFDTIVGYEAHGAIVHYEPTADTDVPVEGHGLVLIDSGGQYLDGTTDITRTISLGPVSDLQRRVYTLVLKGNIRLALAKFPDGASGTQIDAFAREALWREGMNYMHGTGHGVGSYLNVHEGPHQIRQEYVSAPLHAGMTVTDEPGIYLADRFGVRIENTMLIRDDRETEFGRFLCMEPLTLCPIDTAPIIRSMLSQEEVDWLNAYHRHVREQLSPLLSPEEAAWLDEATQEI